MSAGVPDGVCLWRNQTRSGFEQKVYVMFHSTKSWQQAESILQEGFMNSCSTNNMLGAGVYVSRSLNKACTYGPITFKLLVNPGHVKVIRTQGDPMQTNWQEHFGSAWVPPNCGMVPSGLEVNYTLFLT